MINSNFLIFNVLKYFRDVDFRLDLRQVQAVPAEGLPSGHIILKGVLLGNCWRRFCSVLMVNFGGN